MSGVPNPTGRSGSETRGRPSEGPTRGRGPVNRGQARAKQNVGRHPAKPAARPPLTHFICLPLGHHAELRESISTFTTALLDANPPIAGLESSIIISPRRLHLTLGVMSLDQPQDASQGTSDSAERTLSRAAALLNTLRPRVLAMLGDGRPLRVGLERMDVLQPERGDPSRAHVLFVGPDPRSEDVRQLKAVCQMVQKAFTDANLLVNERRELKLHCTLLNTVYRAAPRGARRGPRIPFSYADIRSSAALAPLLAVTDAQTSRVSPSPTPSHAAGHATQGLPNRAPLPPISVRLGSWTVDEIQICRMGSHGPHNEYVADVRCPLVNTGES